jgi:hypothetical protein
MNTLLARTVLIISLGYAGFVVAAEEEEETKEDGPTFVQKNWSRLNNQFASGYPTERSYASYHWPDAVKEMQQKFFCKSTYSGGRCAYFTSGTSTIKKSARNSRRCYRSAYRISPFGIAILNCVITLTIVDDSFTFVPSF